VKEMVLTIKEFQKLLTKGCIKLTEVMINRQKKYKTKVKNNGY